MEKGRRIQVTPLDDIISSQIKSRVENRLAPPWDVDLSEARQAVLNHLVRFSDFSSQTLTQHTHLRLCDKSVDSLVTLKSLGLSAKGPTQLRRVESRNKKRETCGPRTLELCKR